MKGFMYILECSEKSYYVVSTKNLKLRLKQHQNGLGSNHTKKQQPLLAASPLPERSRREHSKYLLRILGSYFG